MSSDREKAAQIVDEWYTSSLLASPKPLTDEEKKALEWAMELMGDSNGRDALQGLLDRLTR